MDYWDTCYTGTQKSVVLPWYRFHPMPKFASNTIELLFLYKKHLKQLFLIAQYPVAYPLF